MTEEAKKILDKVKAHAKYELRNGTLVPGVTTITGRTNKQGLVPWANKLGLEGIDVGKFVDELSIIGTLAHYLIECQLKKVESNTDDFTKNQIEMAQKCVNKFNDWLSENKFELIKSEQKLVSEEYEYGGTCDVYCKLNGKKTLIDIKTSKGTFPEHYMQTSAYKHLLEENKMKVEDVRLIRIGRNELEGFEDKKVKDLDLYFLRFKCLLKDYYLEKKIKNGGQDDAQRTGFKSNKR